MWRVNVTFLERWKKREFEECPQTCVWRLELLLGPVNANECESERAAAMRYSQGPARLFSATGCLFLFVLFFFFSSYFLKHKYKLKYVAFF